MSYFKYTDAIEKMGSKKRKALQDSGLLPKRKYAKLPKSDLSFEEDYADAFEDMGRSMLAAKGQCPIERPSWEIPEYEPETKFRVLVREWVEDSNGKLIFHAVYSQAGTAAEIHETKEVE